VRSATTNYPTREIRRKTDTEAIKRHALENQGIVVANVDDPRLCDRLDGVAAGACRWLYVGL
jgi:hypothetical protein